MNKLKICIRNIVYWIRYIFIKHVDIDVTMSNETISFLYENAAKSQMEFNQYVCYVLKEQIKEMKNEKI